MSNVQSNETINIGYYNLDSTIEKLIEIVENSPQFKRLEEKTQIIFTNGPKDDIKNRLSHTREVAYISQAIAKKNNLSHRIQRLAYLIGLCHDLGHTAFGHDGESRIDAACKTYQLDVKEFNKKFYGKDAAYTGIEDAIVEGPEGDKSGEKKVEYSFEHHAHSVRVFMKILQENNIVLEEELQKDITQGILCHSTSRTEDKEVRKPIWAIARFADKIYPYTDMADILALGIDINIDILDDINECRDGEYITDDKTKEKFPFTSEDKEILKGIIARMKEEGGLERYIEEYIDGSELVVTDSEVVDKDGKISLEKSFNHSASKKMRREMKILKTLAKYLRQEKIMGKEELKARAMIDEVIEYTIQLEEAKGVDKKEACYRASIIVANATDKEIREIFAKISKDVKWQKSKNDRLSHDYSVTQLSAKERSKTYPIKLTPREHEDITRDPESMVQVR